MNLQLSVTKGETSVSLVLENTSNEYAAETVNKIFGFFGNNQEVNIAPKIAAHQAGKKSDVQPKKTIEKINGERTLMYPLAEKLSAALGIQPPSESQTNQGVEPKSEKEDINADVEGRWPYSKYRDGKEYFKCRYYCQCGHKANHYIEEDVKTVSCFKCKATLAVREANEYEQQKLQTRFMATEKVEKSERRNEPEQQQEPSEQESEWKHRRCLSVRECRDCGETIAPGERFDTYYQKGKSRLIVCPDCFQQNHQEQSV